MQIHPIINNRVEIIKHGSCFKFSKDEFRRIIEQKKMKVFEDDYDWWTERMLRHKMFMQLRLTGEIDARLLMDLKNNTASSYVLSLFSPQLSQEELEEKKRIEKGMIPLAYLR